jgi:acetyltransferase AlgX (SGNH hydrolase-like protein)
MPRAPSFVIPRWLVAFALAVQVVLTAGVVQQWLFVGTRRLYLDAAQTVPASARQRFPIRAERVLPEIVAEGGERITFPVALPLPVRLRVRAEPSPSATIEIAAADDAGRRPLAQSAIVTPTDIDQWLPAHTRSVELASEGGVRWVDPRLVDAPGPGRRVAWFIGFPVLLALWRFRAAPRPSGVRVPATVLGGLMLALATALCLAVLEVGLCAMGGSLPSWIAASRRNLGEARPDPRWQDAPRYGPRLAANVRASCQWQHGDIVRMGFMAPGLARHPSYRFRFVTDAEGFRNSDASAPAVVAALGDSFTDAMTLPAELAWPSRLSSLLGASVRNYGTAGFGPGQELLVLKQYVLPRRPRLVVVEFFAGNDLQDAERFEGFQRDGVFPSAGLGWKFKPVIARFDQPYLTSFYQGLLSLRDRGGPRPRAGLAVAPEDYSGDDPAAVPPPPGPVFDRGLFSLTVGGRALRFAFLPPYLNCLQHSREELQASHRWELTRRAYVEMARLVRAQGGELVVMFVPSKSQVYLPLLEASFPAAELRQALSVCLREQPYAPEPEVLLRNRLALNQVMRDFCAAEGIAFLDLTAELQSALQKGHNVYFPDDSHWNAAGHETGAAALARFVRARGL